VRLPSLCISLFVVSACFTCGCGGGGGSSTAPPALAPTFTSVPPTAADEGADYTYQPVATSPDGTAITFSLSSSPAGATLSAGVLSWAPTHDQSRVPNQFSVTATNGKGGSATQSWTVTPSGVVAISDVITYWNSAGPQAQPVAFLPNPPYPSILLLQADGTSQRLSGTGNPDGSLQIPHVPGGYFWLQMSPEVSYWTSSSSFDAGMDLAGSPFVATSQISTTTIDINLTATAPIEAGDLFDATSDAAVLVLAGGPGLPGSTSYSFAYRANSNLDFSRIKTLFFNQYRQISSGSFTGSFIGRVPDPIRREPYEWSCQLRGRRHGD
jgi:Putative Ig domain